MLTKKDFKNYFSKYWNSLFEMGIFHEDDIKAIIKIGNKEIQKQENIYLQQSWDHLGDYVFYSFIDDKLKTILSKRQINWIDLNLEDYTY